MCEFQIYEGLVSDFHGSKKKQPSNDKKWEEMSQEAGRQSKLGMTRHAGFQMCMCVLCTETSPASRWNRA